MCSPSGIGDIRVKRGSATAGNCNFAQGLDVGTAKGLFMALGATVVFLAHLDFAIETGEVRFVCKGTGRTG